MKYSVLFKDFVDSEKLAGLLLLLCTIFSISVANSYYAEAYNHLWQTILLGNTVLYWINEGLMAIFFLLIGLELEREIYNGELSTFKQAILPAAGALGGMVVPASIYLIFNFNTQWQSGAGIPMATDIAFALAMLSLLGNRVPLSLKIFLTALAVVDDLGAIIVIAFFYTPHFNWMYAMGALLVWLLLFILNRCSINNLIPYLLGGILLWYCFLHSGIHASIAGVVLAFVLPSGNGSVLSSAYILQKRLHTPVALFILPIFALANTAIQIPSHLLSIFTQPYAIGIGLGLLVGKVLGIFIFCYAVVKLGLAKLPPGIRLKHIAAIAFFGGVGFTMSIFIAMLAFNDVGTINNAKLVIVTASAISGMLGYFFLKRSIKKSKTVKIKVV